MFKTMLIALALLVSIDFVFADSLRVDWNTHDIAKLYDLSEEELGKVFPNRPEEISRISLEEGTSLNMSLVHTAGNIEAGYTIKVINKEELVVDGKTIPLIFDKGALSLSSLTKGKEGLCEATCLIFPRHLTKLEKGQKFPVLVALYYGPYPVKTFALVEVL